jgi:hypothetical protein
MVNYKLQVFKPYEKVNWKGKSRIAVIDQDKRAGYPLNFVCIFPLKIYDKGKPLSVFAQKFGENSLGYAVKLLEEAIMCERDHLAKFELQKRLNTLQATTDEVASLSCEV